MADQTPEELEDENETLREDAESYVNQIEDLKGQVDRLTAELALEKKRQDDYEENQVGDANEAAINAARQIGGLEQRVRDLEALIASMRLSGAQHHFVYAYQKDLNAHVPGSPQNWVDHCRDCDKEKGHPAHFAQGAQYLDSREVEKAAKEAQERLCDLVVKYVGIGHRQALQVARTVLEGLPGITEPQKGINVLPRLCNRCDRPENNHNASHPFSWGSTF